MQVQVGSYFADDARGAQREVHITLTEEDATKLFEDKWDAWNTTERFERLSGMADIYMLRYAASRDFRSKDVVDEEIRNTVARMYATKS